MVVTNNNLAFHVMHPVAAMAVGAAIPMTEYTTSE
jgi:hypothetical protein